MPRKRKAANRKPAPKKAPPRRKRPTTPKSNHRPTRGLRSGALNLTRTNGPKQQVADMRRALSHADIISVNEVFRNDAALKWARKNGYGVYMAKGPGADTAIVWNKSEVRLVGEGQSIKLNRREGKAGGTRSRFAAYAQFENIQSGDRFWQVSAHTVPLGRGNRKLRVGIRDEQYATLADLAKKLSKSGPVLLAGDLNFKRPEIANLESDMDGKGIMHVMSGNGVFAKNTKALRGFNSDKRFIVTRFGFEGGRGVKDPKAPPVAKPPKAEDPLPDTPGLESLTLPERPKFAGFWEGDLGGGPQQKAPGLAPKQNGVDLVDDVVENSFAPQNLEDILKPFRVEPEPALEVRPDIDFNTASEMVSKVSNGFFAQNEW